MNKKNNKICLKIREFRKSMRLTQSQFAELVNLGIDSVGKIERCVNVPKIATLYQIAKNLKVPIETFLPDNEESPDSPDLKALISYLKSHPPEDTKFIYEITLKILGRNK